MSKTNILHLITGLNIGGAEKVVLDLINHRNQEQFNESVISLSTKKDLLPLFQEHGVNVTTLDMKTSLGSFIKGFRYISNYIKENDINLIHAHMTHSAIMSAALKLARPKLAVVFTSHTSNVGSFLRELSLFVLKPFRNIDVLFSDSMKAWYYKHKTAVIPNGIDTQRYATQREQNNNGTINLLTVGRLQYVKNHKLLIEVAKQLKDKYNFQISIAGVGELKEELEELINRYDLNEHVKLLGYRRDIPELCAEADVFVLPSHWEGLPIVILEAGASGLPIISTPVGSIPALINEKNGYLSSTDNFVETVEHVLNNLAQAREKGISLQKDVQDQYDIKKTVQQYEDIYTQLIK